MEPVIVIGAGLAGSEAAWQLARRGIPVTLREMKPQKMTPAHHSPSFGELVCSNSLRSDQLENAVGLLKEELRRLDSLILSCADAHRVEAGGALAVDREAFAAAVTEKIKNHPNIEVVYGEVTEIPEGRVVIASGPLTSDTLFDAIHAKVGGDFLHFYDAAAPIVTAEHRYGFCLRGFPLRQGHGGLHQLPVLPRGVRGVLERTDHRRGSAGARLRGLQGVRGLHAHRGQRAPRL